jgi:hypothetical protein
MNTPLENPDEIRHRIWRELGRASQDRHHAWRTPVLATEAEGGGVDARTVVLRRVDAALGTLVFFTDQRSRKVADIAQHPGAVLVFWSDRLRWQLRVRALASAQTSGTEVDALWQRVGQSSSAEDYLAPVAPGTPRADAQRTQQPVSDLSHFTVLTAQVTEMDWLELGRAGRRRAQVLPDAWEWLTP